MPGIFDAATPTPAPDPQISTPRSACPLATARPTVERDVRVVVARAEVEDLVAEIGQDPHDGGVERCSGVIDPDRDDHRQRP